MYRLTISCLVSVACVGASLTLSRSTVVDAETLAAIRGGDETVCAVHYTNSGHTGCRTCDSAGQHCYWDSNSGGPVLVCFDIWKQCTPDLSNDLCLTHETYLYRCDLDATPCSVFPSGTAKVYQDEFCTNEVTGLSRDCDGGTYDKGTTTPDPGLTCDGV